MSKTFEDFFSQLQMDMVAVCLEYVNNQADDIYIYGSYEPQMYFFDAFYRMNKQVVHKHELNKVNGQRYDVSDERQWALLDAGIEDLKEIHKKHKEFNHDMPTEIKLHYDVTQNKLSGKYRYDLVYSNSEELLPDHIFDAWFEEVKHQEN
ncbi:DUF600 domain-containing protein [Bhargavaea massiliensis]|uniref:DUF600 domain-containing protein n=1 Tax=Bhargavaea massiliensis TaxID=2697500 RepID=UPI0030136459